MEYGSLLSRAWKISWNNKILWLFGFLAALGAGGGGGGGRTGFRGAGAANLPPDIERQLERPEVIAVILAVACVLILIALAVFVLSVIGRGGLIGGIRLADDSGRVTFSEAWSAGTRYFWRLLLLSLILTLATILVGSFGALAGLLGAFTLGIALICLLPILCLLIIALIPLSIWAHFAQFAVVIDDLSVMDAFRKAWEVIKANIGPIIVLGIILIAIGFVAGLVLAGPFIALVIPSIIAFAVNPENPNVLVLVGSGLALLCYLPIAIVLGSILQTWTTSVWTLAYRRFTAGSASAPALSSAPTLISGS